MPFCVPTAPRPPRQVRSVARDLALRLPALLATDAGQAIAAGIALFALARLGVVVDHPAWLYVALIVGAAVLRRAVRARAGSEPTIRWLWFRAVIATAGITAVIYATGWGPALASVYVVGVIDAARTSGSRAAVPWLVTAPVGIAVGELAHSVGLMPTRLPDDVIYGLDVLSVLALVLVVSVVRSAYRNKETAEAVLAAREARFRALAELSVDVEGTIDPDGRLDVHTVSALRRLIGARADGIGHPRLTELVHPDDAATVREAIADAMRAPDSTRAVEFRIRHADGSWLVLAATLSNHEMEPAVGGLVLNCHDVTGQRRLEAELRRQALHDALTGLANRRLLADRLAQAVARRDGRPALLMLDLDEFKAVNDRLGHAAGDRLLVVVAERLRGILRRGDTLARLGGDEFAILLHDADAERAGAIAERACTVVRSPVDLGAPVCIGASIGIAIGVGGETTPEELMREADVALYAAKRDGRNRFAFFAPHMDEVVTSPQPAL